MHFHRGSLSTPVWWWGWVSGSMDWSGGGAGARVFYPLVRYCVSCCFVAVCVRAGTGPSMHAKPSFCHRSGGELVHVTDLDRPRQPPPPRLYCAFDVFFRDRFPLASCSLAVYSAPSVAVPCSACQNPRTPAAPQSKIQCVLLLCGSASQGGSRYRATNACKTVTVGYQKCRQKTGKSTAPPKGQNSTRDMQRGTRRPSGGGGGGHSVRMQPQTELRPPEHVHSAEQSPRAAAKNHRCA